MSAGRIIAIGGAFWLYRQGYLDALIAKYVPSMSADSAQTQQPFVVDATGQFFPIEQEVQAPPMTTEERWLSDNWDYGCWLYRGADSTCNFFRASGW